MEHDDGVWLIAVFEQKSVYKVTVVKYFDLQSNCLSWRLGLSWCQCALTPYPIRSLSIFLAFQSHSVTMLKYLVPCLILLPLFLNIPRLSQNLASITPGPLNKIVVHLTTQLSALLPLLLSLLDLIMLTPFYMVFQLNTPLVSSGHKTPLHVLSQVLALLAHPL